MTIELTETQKLVKDVLTHMPWEVSEDERSHVHVTLTTEEDEQGNAESILRIYANGRLKKDPEAYCKSCGHRLSSASDVRFNGEFKWVNGRYVAPGHGRRHNLTNRIERLREKIKSGHA